MQTNRASTTMADTSQQRKQQQEIHWVPPLASFDEDQIQLPQELDYSNSDHSSEQDRMESRSQPPSLEPDFVVDADGFLVPLDGYDDDDDDDDDDESSSSLIGDDGDDHDDDEDSIDTPYSELKHNPKEFGSKSFSKSMATLSTEALTLSHTMDDSFFYSPRTPHTPHSQQQQYTPRKLVSIPGLSEQMAKACALSPLLDPSPGNALSRQILKQLFLDEQEDATLDDGDEAANSSNDANSSSFQNRMHQSFESLDLSLNEDPCRSSFFIPGITAPGRTLDDSVNAVKFQPKTPRQRKLVVAPEQQQQQQQVPFSPLRRASSARRRQLEGVALKTTTGLNALSLSNSWDTTEDAAAEPNTPRTPSSRKKVTTTTRPCKSKSVTSMAYSPGGGASAALHSLSLANSWDTTEDSAAEPNTPRTPSSTRKQVTTTTRPCKSKSVTSIAYSPGGGASAASNALSFANSWDTTEEDAAAEPNTPRTPSSRKKATTTTRPCKSKSVTSMAYSPGGGASIASNALSLANSCDTIEDTTAEPITPRTPSSRKKVTTTTRPRKSKSVTSTVYSPGGGGQSSLAMASSILDRPPTPRRPRRRSKLSASSPPSSTLQRSLKSCTSISTALRTTTPPPPMTSPSPRNSISAGHLGEVSNSNSNNNSNSNSHRTTSSSSRNSSSTTATPRQYAHVSETSNSNRTASSSSRSSTANTTQSSSYDKHQSTPVPRRRSASSRRQALLLDTAGPIPLIGSMDEEEEKICCGT
jgi:hypothetical protein